MIQDRREVGVVGDGVAGGVKHDKTEAAKSPEVRLCITSDHGARGWEAYRRRRQRQARVAAPPGEQQTGGRRQSIRRIVLSRKPPPVDLWMQSASCRRGGRRPRSARVPDPWTSNVSQLH